MDHRFEERVREAILRLRRGEVATYGEIAEEAGHPGAARAVGNLLARGEGLPWWRVIRSNGRLAAGDPAEQARRLEEEGVRTAGQRVLPVKSRPGAVPPG